MESQTQIISEVEDRGLSQNGIRCQKNKDRYEEHSMSSEFGTAPFKTNQTIKGQTKIRDMVRIYIGYEDFKKLFSKYQNDIDLNILEQIDAFNLEKEQSVQEYKLSYDLDIEKRNKKLI